MRRRLGILATAALLGAAQLQTGCVAGVAAGGAATAGVLGAQERSFAQAASDAKIRAQINDAWLRADERMYRLTSLQVWNGRVLVSGVVPNEDMRVLAIEKAWTAEGVKEVINEIRVGETGGAGAFTGDAWITAKLKTKLTFDKEVNAANYSIDTVHDVIYLLGTAHGRDELQRVIDHARNVSGVERVVSHVRVRDSGDQKPARPAVPADGAQTGT
ncbi:Osmotically-inducible protein OsmY, contains BON domain [Limimonas halophila]|uniref:Osmotically-inducible protein OsmY, contains BON domain n=1 Tax=Limimonas halophila TaxID=1082479 RepID=A0A1G7SQF6_9PROT|nr:BON domain-containing protein [Limimonas halophila]SDG25034.1 Osmotically-inducible protein OsmY, contains BON domain [Limimonas halophila]